VTLGSGEHRLPTLWSPEARAQLRAIDQTNALNILHCLDRYTLTRKGDVKKLKPPESGLRLRCGDYRIFFEALNEDSIEITGVKHRREAYR